MVLANNRINERDLKGETMTKQEFENMAMRGGCTIGYDIYHEIEYFYMSNNDYHKANGGIDETKQDFVNRVFGGKVNTRKTVVTKLALETCKENRFALTTASKTRLDEMDNLIIDHYQVMDKYDR